MNLKITNAQMQSYKEEQKMPDLQYLANRLCEDTDMEYVELTSKSKKQASTEKTNLPYINVPEEGSIFTKLNDYPYEFEIDATLRLASIDGTELNINGTGLQYSNYYHFYITDYPNYKNLTIDNLSIQLNTTPFRATQQSDACGHLIYNFTYDAENGHITVLLTGTMSHQSWYDPYPNATITIID